MSKQFYLFKKAVRNGVEDNIFLTLWDFVESWTSQNDWMAIFFIIFLAIIFEILLLRICTSFQKKPALAEKGNSDSQENDDSSLKSLTFDNWSTHSSSEERVDDFSERIVTSSLTSEENEGNIEKRVSPADEIMCADTRESKYQKNYFRESHTASSTGTSSSLSPFHSEIKKIFLSHRQYPENENKIQCSSKKLFSIMKTNKNKSVMFSSDFNFLRTSGITTESEDLDVAPCPPAHLFLSRDQVRLLEENVKNQIPLKPNATLESKTTLCSRSQESLIQNQRSVRMDISAQAQDSFPAQSAIQNQGFYETQFTNQAQQFVNHQDLINSQPDIESRHFAVPQDLRRKPFSSSTQDPFQTQDMDRSQHLVKVPYSVETRDSIKGLECDKNPTDEVQYYGRSEDSHKIRYSIQGQNTTIFKNARSLVLALSPNSVAKGMPQLKSIKPKSQKQIATSKLNQYSVYGLVSLSSAIKRHKNRRKTLHSKTKFSLKVPSPKSKKTPPSWVFQIAVCHTSKRSKLGCKYYSKKKELHQSEEMECNIRSNIKNMQDKRISDAFHNATNTMISEPPDTEMHSELKAKTDTPRIIGLSHSVVKQEKLPDEKKIWNAKCIEKGYVFKKPQEHDREEEEQTLQEAVSQLTQDFGFSRQLKQKPKSVEFQIGQSSSGSRKTQNKEQEIQPQTLSTQTILGTCLCSTMDPFQVEKVKQSEDRPTGRETADPKTPLTVPKDVPAGEVFTEMPEWGVPFGESPRQTPDDHIAEEKADLRPFVTHVLPLSYVKRQKIRKKIAGTISVLNPKCVNMKVKKPAILLMPYLNRHGTPCLRKRLSGNLNILIKQMLPAKIMADVRLNVIYSHVSILPRVRTHSRLNAENHHHMKLKQEKSQIEREEINKEGDSGNTLEEAKLQDELKGNKETPPKAVLNDSWSLRLDAHPEKELKTEEENHQPITSAETIMESVSSFIMDLSHAENIKKSLTTQTDLKCTADSEIPPHTLEKSLIGDPLNQTRESDVSDYGSDTREMDYCFAETMAELPKDLPATFPETFNCHVPDLTHSKVKEKRVRFSHINCTVRPKSIPMKTTKPSVSQLFNVTGHREKLESNFKTQLEIINQANGLAYEFLNALYSPMHSRLQGEANGFCHAQLKQGELRDEGRPRYVDFFDKRSAFDNKEAKVQDGEEVEQKPLLDAAPQHTRCFSADACQGEETHLDKPDPALNCLTQELQYQTCVTQTALQTDLQTGPREAEEPQKTNKTENAITAPMGLKIPPPKAGNSSLDKHLNRMTECGLSSGRNPEKQLDSYFVGKNLELQKDLQATFLMSSDSVEPFVPKSERKKKTSRTARKQITVNHRTMRGKKPSISHMLNDSQSKGLKCNLKTKMKNPQQNKNVADTYLDTLHSKVPIFPSIKMSSRLSVETDIQRITRLGHMQLMQEKPPNGRKVCCPDCIDMSSLSIGVKNGKAVEGEHEALPAPENSQDFIVNAYQENRDLVQSDEELKQPESIHIQAQPQMHSIQTILDSAPCPILDHFQFGKVENGARFSPPKSGEAKIDKIIFSTREGGVPSEENHPKEQAGDIEKQETVTFDCCMPACSTSKRKRNFKQYLGMKTLVNPKCEILKAKKPSISYILNIKGSPSHRKELGFNLTTKTKEVHQGKKMADKMCSFMSIIHDTNMYSEIEREKDMLGEERLSSKQGRQAISHEGNIISDDTKETNLQGEEEEDSEQETLLKVVLQHSQHFVFCSDQRAELDLHKSENKRSRKILFAVEQDVPHQMQPTDPVQVEEPKRSHQTQNGTIYTASSKFPLIKSKESLVGEGLIDTMTCSDASDGSHTEKLYSHGKEEKAEFKKDQQATVLESLDVTTPDPSESKRQRKTFTCTALKIRMSPKGVIMKARKTPISKIFTIPGNGCLKIPSKTLKSQIIDFLIYMKHFAVLEDLTVERKEGLAQELPAMILESLDVSTLALPTSKRNILKLIHKKNKMSPKCVTLKAKKSPTSQTFNITKRGTPIHGRQFECNFKTMMKQRKPVAHIMLNAISSAMPISLDMKVRKRIKVETDMPWKMRFSHEPRQQEPSPDGERAWYAGSSDKRDSTSESTKKVQDREAVLRNSQHFSFKAHKIKEPHFVKSDLELKNSARKKVPESLPTAQEMQQQTLFTQSVLRSISCSILNLLPFEKLPKRTETQKGLNDTGSPKILSLMPSKSISESLIVTAQSGLPFEKSPQKEVASSMPEGEIRLQKDFQERTLEPFDVSMPASSEFKGQGNAAQICKSRTGAAQMASVLRTVNVTRSGALRHEKEQDHILENMTKEIPLGMSNIFINTFLSSTPVSPAVKTHKKVKAKKGPLIKTNITHLKQDEGKTLNTYASNKWSTSNNTSESRWQNEKEKEGNELLLEAHLQFLNGIGSGKDQNMLIVEQEVQQKTLVSANILESTCSPLIPTKNLKKNIPPQKAIRHRIGEKIPHPKPGKAMFDDLLINETTFDGSPTRKLDVNSAVYLQSEEEKEDIKTIKYTVDQNIPPTKSGSSVLGEPCNKSCRRKVGGPIAKNHEDLQRELLTVSTTSVLSESNRQKKVLKFPERKNLTYFWSLKTPFSKAGKSETDSIQCDTLWDGNPRMKFAKAANVKNSVHTKQAKVKTKKPLGSQMPNTTGYGAQSNKKKLRCDIHTQKKAFQQGKTVADLVLSPICDSGSIPSQIKGFVEVKRETDKSRKVIRVPPPLKLNKSLRRKMSSSQSTDKSVISRNIKTLKQYITEQKDNHQTVLLDILSQGRDQLVINQQVEKEPDHVKLAVDLGRDVYLDLSSQERQINYTRFDIPQIRTHTEIEFLTAPRIKHGDVDIVECSVSFPWGREVSEKTGNSLSSKGQNMFLTELDASQQKICKEQELLKQGNTSMTNLESTACPITEPPNLENTGKVAEKDMYINRKNISHLLGREGLKETDILQGQKFLCINLEVEQNMSAVKPDHIPESILDSVSCPNREPLHVKQSVNTTREENVSIPISLDVNPWKKEQLKLTDIPLKSNRQKMNFSEKTRAKQLNSSKENIVESISSCILHYLHIEQLKKEVSAKGIKSTVLGQRVEKSSKEAGIPVDQPPCSEGINLHIRGRKEHQQESMCKVLPTSISYSSLDILQIKSPWVKKAFKAIDSPTQHTSNTEGKEEQPECIHQTFTKLASHSLKEIFQSQMPCKKKISEEMVSTVDYTLSAEGIGSLITRKGEQQEKCTCEMLPKPASYSKTGLLQINTPLQQVKSDDTNMMHCEYLTSQAKEALKVMDDIVGYTQKSEKRQNLFSIEQKQQHLLIPYENFLERMSYPQNDPWLRQNLMPQTKKALSEVGSVSSRTTGLDLFSKDQPNTVCEYELECTVPSIPPKQMKKQNAALPLESCSETIRHLNVSFPKGKKSLDRAEVIDLTSNGSSPRLRIRKKVPLCKAYQKKVQKDICLPGMFSHSPSVFMPILPESKIQKDSVKQRVKKDIICSRRRTFKLKKSVFPNTLDITDCGTPGNRPELQCNIKEKTVNKKQRKGKPDLVVTNIYEFIPALPHLKLNTQIVDGIITNNFKRTKQHISQTKEEDRIKGVNMKGIMNLNVILKGKKSSLSHTLDRKEMPAQIKQESKMQIGEGKSGVKLTTLCTSLPSLSCPNWNSRIKVGEDKAGIPRSCLPPLKLQASSDVRKTSFAESINRDSLINVIKPKQHLPQKKREDRENIVYVKNIMGFKCITFKGKKTPFKHILHGKEPQWKNKEQEKVMQEDKSDLHVVQNKAHASIPSLPYLERSPGIKGVYMRGITRCCFPLTLQELTDAVEIFEEPTGDTSSSIKKAKFRPQKEEDRVEMALEDIRHPKRIALKAKQPPIAQELQLNIKEKEKKLQEDKDKQVGMQSKFCAFISLPPYSAVNIRIKGEAAMLIKTRSSFLQPKFQGSADIGKMVYKKSLYGDISNSVKKAKEHTMQEKDERIKMAKAIPLKKMKSSISQEIQWDIKEQEKKIQNFKCQSSVILTNTSTSMPDASHLKLDTKIKKADYLTEVMRYSLPELSHQKSSDAEKREYTKSVGGDTISDVKSGQDYEPQKGEKGGKIVTTKDIMYCKNTTSKAKTLPLPRVLGTPRDCGSQIKEVQTNIKEKLGHTQERKSELDEVLTRPSLPQFKFNKSREGKEEKRGITRPFLSCSWQKESSDADKLKYTVSPLNDISSDSKRTKYMMRKEEDKAYVFKKDIMHPMCAALKAKTSPLFHILKTKELQVNIEGQMKRGQESNKDTIVSEICPFVTSLTHLKLDAIKEEEGEPGIIRNYVPCLELQQSLSSGQIAFTKFTDNYVEKGKQHLPQKEKDRMQNRNKVEKDLLEITGLSPLQLQFPVSSGAEEIKYADSNEDISSCNVMIKVSQHMPCTEAKDKVQIEDGKGRLFPQITLRAEISPLTHLLSRKRLHLHIEEQWKDVHEGQGKSEVVLRKTSASLPFPSPLKQETRMNGKEDTLRVTQSHFPPLKSQDPSNPGKKAYTKSFDGYMLKEEDRPKIDIEDNMFPIDMDLMAKKLPLPHILNTKELQWKIKEQKRKVQEDKNKLVTNVKNICTSLLTLPYLKFDTTEEEGYMIRVTKLPLPQLQSKELSDAAKIAYAETDGELSSNIKEFKEHMLHKEEKDRDKKVDVNGVVDPNDMFLNAKKSPILLPCNLGDLRWKTEEQEGKVREAPCEPVGVMLTKTCASTASPLHHNMDTRIKEKSTPTLTRSSVSAVHVQELADSEEVVYIGPITSDIWIRPQKGKQCTPQDKEEDGVEIINLMFPRHQEKKIQERKDEPGVLLTQSPTSLPSLPHIDLGKEILVGDEMLVLKRSVLQRISNAGEIVHPEPINGEIMKDVQSKKQHVPQKEERDREKTVAVRVLTHTTDRTLKSKKSPPYVLHRTELHLNIGRQEQKKQEGQGKPPSTVLRKVYVSKPPPTNLKMDKGIQVDGEGLRVKRPCLFPLRLSALSDAEKTVNTEAIRGGVRKRKQYISQKEKIHEVDMRIRMQHKEARISSISHIFNTKEFVLNIKKLKEKVHNDKDEQCMVRTSTFLSIPSAPPLYLDSGSKRDKDTPRMRGSACLQKKPQESLDTQTTAIRESVSGSKIILKKAGCSVPREEAVQQWTSNFMISVQRRNEMPQAKSEGDLSQLIVSSQHEDIPFTGLDTLRSGKRPECFCTGLKAQPEKSNPETFTTFLPYPTVNPTKIENLKKETKIMDHLKHKTGPQSSVSLPKEISEELCVTLGTPVSSKAFSISEEDDHQTLSKVSLGSADSCKFDKPEKDVQSNDNMSKMFSSKVLAQQIKGSLKKMHIKKSNTHQNIEEQEIVMKKLGVQQAESGHKTRLNSSLSLKFPLQNGKQETPLEIGVHEQTAVYPGIQTLPGMLMGITEFDTTRGKKVQALLIPEQDECILKLLQQSPSPRGTFPLQSGDQKEKNETDTSTTINANQKELEMEDGKLKIDTNIAVHLKEDKIEMHKHTIVNLEKEIIKMDTSNTINLKAPSVKAEASQVKTQVITDEANSCPIKQKHKKKLEICNAKQNIQPQKLFQKHILDSLYAYIPLSHKFEGQKGRLTIADLKREMCPQFSTMTIPKHPVLQILGNTGHGTRSNRKKLEYDFNKPKQIALWKEGASGIFIRSLSISMMSPSQTEETIESETNLKREKRICFSKFQEKSPNASKVVKRNKSSIIKKWDQNFTNIVPEDSYPFVVDKQQVQKLPGVKPEANLSSEINKKNLTPQTEERVVPGHVISRITKEPDLLMIKQQEKEPKPILTPTECPCVSEDPKENVETHVKSTLTISISPPGVEAQLQTHLFDTMECASPPEHRGQSEPIQNTTTQTVQQQNPFSGTVPIPPQVKSNEIKIVADSTNAESLLPLYEAIKNVFESQLKNMTQDKVYADIVGKVQVLKPEDWKSPPFAWGPDTTSTKIHPRLQPKPILKCLTPKLKNKLASHLESKALEIQLNLIPEMAKQSFQKFNFYLKLAISEEKSWRLYPRHKKMYFLPLEGIDTIDLNLKHKYRKDSPQVSCMKTLIVDVSSGSKENTTKLKSIKKLESGASAVTSANEMPLSHILQKYPVEEKDKLLIHFSVKTLAIQMKAFPRIVIESYAMADAQGRRKSRSKHIHSGVKVPKQKNRILLLFEEKPLHQIDLDLQYKKLRFFLGIPVESMSPKPKTLPKHILKLNTVAKCKEVDNSGESDSLSIDTELLEKHCSFKNHSPYENSSLIRKFLEPTHVCASNPEQCGTVKKGTTAFLKSHVTPEKDKQCHVWFQETNTHESFDLKTQEHVSNLVDSHSIQVSEGFTDCQTFIESSADLEECSVLEVRESEECMFLEANPYLSQESQNISSELQKGIPLENVYTMKKIKTDLKPFYSEDSGSHHSRGCRKHSSIVTPPSYESCRSRKHRSSSKMQSPDWLCHRSLNTVEVPFVSSSITFSEEKFSWITRNRTNYTLAPLTESNIKLHLRKSQDKPHRHPESKKRKKAKFDVFRKNIHWNCDYSYTQSKEKCTRKKNVCGDESERVDYFPSKHRSASKSHQEDGSVHSEGKHNQPFFYACMPADSLEIIPKTIRWIIPKKTLKKRNVRVPLVAKISSSCSIWSSSRKLLGSLLESFHAVHQS